MEKEELNIQRNKIIITIFVLTIILLAFSCVMLHSEPNEGVNFRHIYNNYTGEKLSVLGSILCYLFVWCVLGILPGGATAVLTMCLYLLLHRKDENLLDRHYHPEYECEIEYGIKLSLATGYAAMFLVILSYAVSIITT